jgi:hypothetical protein
MPEVDIMHYLLRRAEKPDPLLIIEEHSSAE